MTDSGTLAERIAGSPRVNEWRLFRGWEQDVLELVPFLAGLKEISAGATATVVRSNDRFTLLAEFDAGSSSPIGYRGPCLTLAYSESPAATAEFDGWTIKAPMTYFATDAVAHVIGLLRSAERALAAETSGRICASFQFEERLELEFEPWHRNLVGALKNVTSADMWQVRPRAPADFWESRGERWTWKYADDLPSEPPNMDAISFSELCRSGLIECVPAESAELPTAIYLPLRNRTAVLGLLALYYAHPITIFPAELKFLELLQKEASSLLDRTRNRLRMQRMATIDGLTNLFNHHFFRIQLRVEFQRALRYQKKMSLVMIDIDDFKSYNDRYGHLAGDRVLAEVGRVIRSTVRDIDIVARYGGEEFALILPEVDSSGGLVVAEKVRAALSSQQFKTETGDDIGSITVSCGVTDNVNTTGPNDLIRRADRALYWVKTHGRNLVRLADPMNDA